MHTSSEYCRHFWHRRCGPGEAGVLACISCRIDRWFSPHRFLCTNSVAEAAERERYGRCGRACVASVHLPSSNRRLLARRPCVGGALLPLRYTSGHGLGVCWQPRRWRIDCRDLGRAQRHHFGDCCPCRLADRRATVFPRPICPTGSVERILSSSRGKNISVYRNVESGVW